MNLIEFVFVFFLQTYNKLKSYVCLLRLCLNQHDWNRPDNYTLRAIKFSRVGCILYYKWKKKAQLTLCFNCTKIKKKNKNGCLIFVLKFQYIVDTLSYSKKTIVFWKIFNQITEIFGQFMLSAKANDHFHQVLIDCWLYILSEHSNSIIKLPCSENEIVLL